MTRRRWDWSLEPGAWSLAGWRMASLSPLGGGGVWMSSEEAAALSSSGLGNQAARDLMRLFDELPVGGRPGSWGRVGYFGSCRGWPEAGQ